MPAVGVNARAVVHLLPQVAGRKETTNAGKSTSFTSIDHDQVPTTEKTASLRVIMI
jgi:hypothetical protein